MLKKHLILSGIIISLSLLVLATLHYPGGSQADKNAIGYDWRNNYISNLFSEKAINGSDNGGRFWAVAGMFFLSLSFALFFIEFSKKIPAKSASKVIKYCGAGCMLFTFLIATPLHDIMVTISSTMFLIGLFYITVFVFKTRLKLFKIFCVVTLLVFYFTLFMFGSGDFRIYLPIMQKINFIVTITLVLGLNYFTQDEDFHHLNSSK